MNFRFILKAPESAKLADAASNYTQHAVVTNGTGFIDRLV